MLPLMRLRGTISPSAGKRSSTIRTSCARRRADSEPLPREEDQHDRHEVYDEDMACLAAVGRHRHRGAVPLAPMLVKTGALGGRVEFRAAPPSGLWARFSDPPRWTFNRASPELPGSNQ